jgi:predicted membrane protein
MKYILTPITMFLWYLTSYYGLSLVIFGMVYIVALSWFWLIIGYLFLICILFAISNVIPGLFRLLILKIYGINWFSSIVHSLAGTIGVGFFVLNLPSCVLVSLEGDEVFFLTGMWEMAPLKTLLFAFPFAGIIISLLWSTMISPIYMKISGEHI